MTGTLFSLDLLNTGIGFAMAGLIGILFGFFLEQAGFGSSRKLTGIFYLRDMAVLKVMFTAVVTAMIGYPYLVAFGWLAPSQVYVLDTYWGAQAIGGLIFGVGFVVGGWCPGTALVGLASLKWDALVFLVGAVLGSILFNEVFASVASLYSGSCAGTLFLSDSFHMSASALVLIVTIIAVLAFTGSTWCEQLFGHAPKADYMTRRRRRTAALVATILAAGTLFLPEPDTSAGTAGGPALLGAAREAEALADMAAARDHTDAEEVADRLMAGDATLIVVDLRDAEDYDAFHLRGAIHVPLAALAERASAELPTTGQVVLYSNGTTHAAQAWLILRRLGWTNVTVLTDGLLGFWRDCLTPPSLRGLTNGPPPADASAAFTARRAYFVDAPASR